MSLNREVWQRIEQHDATVRRGVRLPSTSTVVAIGANALALAAIAVLMAIIAPGADMLVRQLMLPPATDASTTAAQPTIASFGAIATVTPWPTQTAPPPATPATFFRATEPPTPIAQTPPFSEPVEQSKPAQTAPRPVQPTAAKPDTYRPVATPPVPVNAKSTALPTPSELATSPLLRSVSGTVSFVDRKAKTLVVTSTAPAGERAFSVRVSEGTQYSRADGRRTTFEDLGIADQVDVSGFDGVGQTAGLLASTVRITVSAVTAAPPVRAPRVLYVADGAESIRAGQYGLTGDWARRLASTGYEVTTADPVRVVWTLSTLKDFDLVVIGSPSTLGDAAIAAIKASHLPILNGDPRLVQTLGLGVNVDPANPMRQAPAGRTIDVVTSGSPVIRGLSSGETVVARETLHRVPIMSNGSVLATVVDAGQRRAVWSQTGSTIYFGVWNSGSGSNHTDAYWSMFDRSVFALLGRDPSAGPSTVAAGPTATRVTR
jgi:hypothetical protein